MNSIEQATDGGATSALVMDELLQWELRVAQRADELAPKASHGRDEDLLYWLQAEREVLVAGGGLRPITLEPSGSANG